MTTTNSPRAGAFERNGLSRGRRLVGVTEFCGETQADMHDQAFALLCAAHGTGGSWIHKQHFTGRCVDVEPPSRETHPSNAPVVGGVPIARHAPRS
jgi:hypothetical protein